MKMHGKRIEGPNVETIVIPRKEQNLVFKAQAILSYEDHTKLDPVPSPPTRMLPGGIQSQDIENADYKRKMHDWSMRKYDWMVLKSLQATEELEWETVNISEPSTWSGWRKEMESAGLSNMEVSRIEGIVIDACGLNQSKIDEATKRFLADQARALRNGSSHSSEQSNMPSGEPVSASA